MIGFYDQPETSRREEAWNLLKSLKTGDNQGSCVLGDFIEIITNDEKMGGKPRLERQMESFKAALEVCLISGREGTSSHGATSIRMRPSLKKS